MQQIVPTWESVALKPTSKVPARGVVSGHETEIVSASAFRKQFAFVHPSNPQQILMFSPADGRSAWSAAGKTCWSSQTSV